MLLLAPPNRQKWLGIPVIEHEGTLDEIGRTIPHFTRRPFTLNGENGHPSKRNRFFDMIVQDSNGSSDSEMPVGVVSKSYNLLQHTTVLEHAIEAMRVAKVNPHEVRASMRMTENGERMELQLHFPKKYSINPEDEHSMGLRLICVNSVDGSLKFFATLGWFRFVCSNGLIIGTAKLRLKERHSPHLDIAMIGEVLKRDLISATADQNRFKVWFNTKIKAETLRRWVDEPLKAAWGVKAATRAYHITITGRDVDLVSPFEKAPPSRRQVKTGAKVPGASEGALNAYGVCQVLSWLAKERREFQEHIERQQEIEPLIERLITLNRVRRRTPPAYRVPPSAID